jgi:hypothetical protein
MLTLPGSRNGLCTYHACTAASMRSNRHQPNPGRRVAARAGVSRARTTGTVYCMSLPVLSAQMATDRAASGSTMYGAMVWFTCAGRGPHVLFLQPGDRCPNYRSLPHI